MVEYFLKYLFTQKGVDKVVDDIIKENDNAVKSVSSPIAATNAC